MTLTFHGRHVLILGGTCELAACLVPLLLAEGLSVRATATAPQHAERLAGLLPAEHVLPLRLGDTASVAAFIEHLPPADYLVDLAHPRGEDLLLAQDPDVAEALFRAMGSHRLRLVQAVGRAMLARRFGRMLHVSSTAAARPAPGQGLYCALKRAAEGLYQALGVELAGRGVTTVSLRLGITDAGRGAAFLEKRPGLPGVGPQDAAAFMLYLLSDQGQSIQSTTITMDAGLLGRKYAT